jgi:hypothetical protein
VSACMLWEHANHSPTLQQQQQQPIPATGDSSGLVCNEQWQQQRLHSTCPLCWVTGSAW